MTPVFILDGSLQSALSAARSLGRRGVRVVAGAERCTNMSAHSRYAAASFCYTSPLDDEACFVADVLQAARREAEPPIVFCFSDLTYLPLARRRGEIDGVLRFALPAASSVETAFDKAETLRLAASLDIPKPQTSFPENETELAKIANETRYPAIVKPRHSCVWRNENGVWGKAQAVESVDALSAACRAIHDATGEWPLVQEKIEGEEFGVFGLYWHGERKAAFAHHRLRSMDAMGGASVLRESIELPADLARHSWALLDRLAWHGPAMVEWKRDAQSGEPKLMEINGRFWGSLPLAIASGVDFPRLLYRLETGESVVSPTYRSGVRSRHLLADFLGLLRRTVSSSPGKGKALREFFRFREPNMAYDVESWEDPMPTFWEWIDAIAKRL